MGKGRQPEIILKTDEKDTRLELLLLRPGQVFALAARSWWGDIGPEIHQPLIGLVVEAAAGDTI